VSLIIILEVNTIRLYLLAIEFNRVFSFQDCKIDGFICIINARLVLRGFGISPSLYCILCQIFSHFFCFNVLFCNIVNSWSVFSLVLRVTLVFFFAIAHSVLLFITSKALKRVRLFVPTWLRHGYYHYAVSKNPKEVYQRDEETNTGKPDISSPFLLIAIIATIHLEDSDKYPYGQIEYIIQV
jgi:hypothetical protein